MYIDTHCHLNYDPLYHQVDKLIQAAHQAGVNTLICVGTDLDSSRRAVQLADKYSEIYATVGIHPHDARELPNDWSAKLKKLSHHKKVVALGEIGLDYYRNYASHEKQRQLFVHQILLAQSLQLPMVIHNRRADDDMRLYLQQGGYFKGVLHCFSSKADFARDMLALGLHISFTGNVTYGSKKTEQAVKAVPLERLMLETDAPFLTPASLRGQTNQPANIPIIARRIAEIKKIELDTVAQQTTATANQFFQLPV